MAKSPVPADRAGTSASRARSVILASMTVANAMVLVDQTAVPLALPSIMGEFGVDSQSVQWVLNGSLLPLAGLLVLGGRMGDLFGRRRIFVLGSVLFAAASALAGLAPTFDMLIAFRVLQGAGGALMLPTTVAIVSSVYSARERGKALGTMGGAAAVAGAFGPIIGGSLTTAFGWRSVLLVNVPLALVAVLVALRAIRKDPVGDGNRQIDLRGTVLLSVALVGLVFGLAQSQDWGWSSLGVLLPLAASVAAAVLFVRVETSISNPLLDFSLLRRYPNYLGATISQAVAGMAEMGLGILFPLILILNLGMPPALAGLALIPTTLPMVLVAPLAGRWYDRVGGRLPLVTGFLVLAGSGILLAGGTFLNHYLVLLPGLLAFGVGLAIVLTVNDPVSLDSVPEKDHGQASGVSATAEQFGGALGIALLYLAFHVTYVETFITDVSNGPLANLSQAQLTKFRNDIVSAEQTGLTPSTFDPAFTEYLTSARFASNVGFGVAFLLVSVLAVIAAILIARLVRPPLPERNREPAA